MKKALILLTSAVAMMALAAAPGCSGGGDDDDDDDGTTLASGTYAVTNAGISGTCSDNSGTSYYSGVTEVDVTVAGASLDISGFPDDLTYDVTGTALYDSVNSPGDDYAEFDFSVFSVASANGMVNTYNCVISASLNYEGTITGTNEFSLADVFTLVITSGNQCAAVVTSNDGGILAIPCTETDGADLAL